MKNRFKIYIFALIPLLVLLTIMEMGCRAYDYFTKTEKQSLSLRHLEPYLMFSPKPNQKVKTDHGEININSLGFRGKEITFQKPDSTYRIVLLGGSVGFNGTSDSTTIVGYVGQLLEKNGGNNQYSRLETINAAVPSYISTQEMLCLILKIVDLNPDLVIIFDGINDWAQFPIEPRVGYPYLFANLEKSIEPVSLSTILRDILSLSSFSTHLKKWMNSLTNNLKVIAKKILSDKTVKRIRKSKGLKKSQILKHNSKEAVDLFVKNQIKIQKICDCYNIHCIHINQPNIARKKHLTKEETNCFNHTYGENILLMESEALKRLNSIKEKGSFIFYDFGDIFDNENQAIYYDFCHFIDTDYANYIIAKRIIEIIFQNRLI